MKIAFLHFWTLRLPRGVETLTLSLANALAEQGVEVSILTARRTITPLVEPSARVRLREFPTARYYAATAIVPFYAAELVREKYDAVIVFFADFGEGRALQIASPFTKPRMVLYCTFPYESAPHRYEAYKKWGWERRADVILADAEYTAERAEEFLGRAVKVLPSGTEPRRFKPDAEARARMRAQLGFEEGEVVLLNVAALERRKGAWRVIEALPVIRERCPKVKYLIMGEGAEREPLERRAKALGVEGTVRFGGVTNVLPGYYNAADIFVMLPDAEAGSIALLEAMASGLPVVVADSGGFGQVVSEDCGVRVLLNDAAALADACVELAMSAERRRAQGAAGRRRVIEHYSWDALAAQLKKWL